MDLAYRQASVVRLASIPWCAASQAPPAAFPPRRRSINAFSEVGTPSRSLPPMAPSTGDKWPRRRTPGLAPAASQATYHQATDSMSSLDEDPIDVPSTSGRQLPAQLQALQGSGRPLLQLVAAWDALAEKMPQESGTSPGADLLLQALKLVLAQATPEGANRALSLANRLAPLAGDASPVDIEAIAAATVMEAFRRGQAPPREVLEARVGPSVAALMHDLRRVAALPSRADLYDDDAAAALRELCLAFYDVRATATEVVARLHSLRGAADSGAAPAELQIAALEALQIYSPMGHALGLGAVSAELEEVCFQILFPASYTRTAAWLRDQATASAATLEICANELWAAAESSPRFRALAAGLWVHRRTKSPFSTLKKLLRLGDMARGGRALDEIHDVLGIRVVVLPREDVPAARAEAAAVEACYLVQALAHSMWSPVEGRSKDYMAAPKANGYQSLHSTVQLPSSGGGTSAGGMQTHTLELQIRTQAMHVAAESGEAAHAAYKGGLDAAQVRQLRLWTNTLVERSALASTATSDSDDQGAASAAEGLFRHLDLDGDGCVSVEELQHALRELGAGAGGAAAAEALLALADGNPDGTLSLHQFLEFQRRVGLAEATLALDRAALHLLESGAGEDSSDSSSEWTGYTESEGEESSRFTLRPAGSSSSGSGTFGGRFITPARQGSSSLHVWGSHWEAVTRRQPARSVACASFLERDDALGGGGGSSGSSSVDEVLDLPSHASSSSSKGYVARRPSRSMHIILDGPPQLSSSSHDGSSHKANSASAGRKHEEAADRRSPPQPSVAPPPPAAAAPTSPPALIAKPDRPPSFPVPGTMHGFMRMLQPAGVARLDAEWELVPLPSTQHDVRDAAGQDISAAGSGRPLSLPRHGPCVVGAVLDRDCDVVIDVPTVSGRHARLEVLRRRTAGRSNCSVMDLGSTNGTFVNRARIVPYKEVLLYPGDVVCLAEPGVAFEVKVVPAQGDPAAAAGTPAAAVPDQQHQQQERGLDAAGGAGPAVSAALRIAAALESDAAARGIFAPATAAGAANVAGRARELLTEGQYQAAYMLLLGGAMACPQDGGLWAQLASTERQRARRCEQGSTAATARAFLRAAVECFEGLSDAGARRTGLARVFSTWAQLEYDLRNDAPARALFTKAVRAATNHPDGPAAASAAKLLFTWANRERKLGDAAVAARLCGEALEVEPTNPYALTLLANIQADAGQPEAARALFSRAVDSNPSYLAALQSWGRMEAAAGDMRRARALFRRALRLDPSSRYVLQAWAVAEATRGSVSRARGLLRQCTEADPACRAAWHAWGKLEDRAGNVDAARELYRTVLQLNPSSVEALSALGCLERRTGNVAAAEQHLRAALAVDARHTPSMQELATLLRAQSLVADGYLLEKRAKRANLDRRAKLAQVRNAKPKQPSQQQPPAQ